MTEPWRDELMPLGDPRYDPARPNQFLVTETIRHAPVYPDRLGWWDRITRRRPTPAEIDAVWAIVHRERKICPRIECVLGTLQGEQPIPGADYCELLLTIDGTEHTHPGIGIEWPWRSWWIRRLAEG